MIKKYKIFNKSCQKMGELENESIDLIITSPPYNIGTEYGCFQDNYSFESYLTLLISVVKESYRVQKRNSKLIVEIADSIKMEEKYVQLAGLFQSICLNEGYFLLNRDINFIKTQKGIELPDYGFDNNYSTYLNTHSNCHQILTFSKEKRDFEGGEINYLNYEKDKKHPCPFPKKNLDYILNKHFKKENFVLDPFMGTANLG
ncbi:hypothetical protein C0585_01750, partial [Candidatus Woesearchaeota archaeon]